GLQVLVVGGDGAIHLAADGGGLVVEQVADRVDDPALDPGQAAADRGELAAGAARAGADPGGGDVPGVGDERGRRQRAEVLADLGGPGRGRLAQLLHRRAGAASESEEHTSELQSRENLVCRLLLEKNK